MALKPNEKKLLKILAAVIVVGGFILYRSSRPQKIETTPQDPEKVAEAKAKATTKSSSGGASSPARSSGGGSKASSSGAPSISVVSIDDYENHKSPEDCWVLIDGKVYDITQYIKDSSEPEKIAPFCGSFAFEEGYLDVIASTKDAVINRATLKGTIG